MFSLQNDFLEISYSTAQVCECRDSSYFIGMSLEPYQFSGTLSDGIFIQKRWNFLVVHSSPVLIHFNNNCMFQCDQMRICLYQCRWHTQPKPFKYKVAMTLMRLQKPVFLSIGKFSPLNLATFMTVRQTEILKIFQSCNCLCLLGVQRIFLIFHTIQELEVINKIGISRFDYPK